MGDDMAIDMNDLKAPVGGVLEGLGNLPNIPPAILQQASSLLAKDWSMKLQDRSFANVGANITLPLYTGGKINAANNAAKIRIEEVAEKGNQTRGSLVSELTERYYGLVLALQVVEVRRQVLEGMQHHLSDAKALEANGIIAKGERLYAEVHTAEAERELLKAQKTVETLYSALSNTLGGDESTYIPATSMFILSDIESVSYFKDLAKQHSPLLKQVGYKKQLATENMRLQRADFAPQVALTGMAAFYNYQVSPIIPKWAVGAGVSLKIFDGLNREYKFSAAKSQIRQVEAVGHQAESDILTPDRQALQRDGHLFAAAAFGQRIRPVRRGILANQGRGVQGRSRPVVGRRGRAAQSGQNPHRTASGGLLLRHDGSHACSKPAAKASFSPITASGPQPCRSATNTIFKPDS